MHSSSPFLICLAARITRRSSKTQYVAFGLLSWLHIAGNGQSPTTATSGRGAKPRVLVLRTPAISSSEITSLEAVMETGRKGSKHVHPDIPRKSAADGNTRFALGAPPA